VRQTVFTIGHSNHSFETLAGLLAAHGIQAVCDVRSIPASRRNPQFNRERLAAALQQKGTDYLFFGKELGARSPCAHLYVGDKVQYSLLAREPAFLHALQRIRSGAQTLRLALMCAERDPVDCHRAILVCRELRSPDLDIRHILADGTLETHADLEARLMRTLKIVPDLWHDTAACIERAYDVQAERIAFRR
jgi:uncharacterized protein (DUF488 family)